MKRRKEHVSAERAERDRRYAAEPPLGLSIRRLNHYGAFQRGPQVRRRRRSTIGSWLGLPER